MFNHTPLARGFALEMGTRLENVDRCVERIRLFLAERDGERHLFSLSLLAREALNNAMIHGNRMRPEKKVRFRLLEREGGFDLEIEDEGPGFDWRERMRASSKAEDVSGRGHEIFRNYARAVRYNPAGNAMTLEYRG
ncbi:MAG: ATP-binding protein [Desulfomicrobium sp.]